jgi:trehalose 6-phosphate phosphatase
MGSNLRLLPFDGGVELRSLERNKGSVVQDILAQEPPGLPTAYLGDDLTDEDAFVALGDRGHSILVRPELRESAARFWLKPPEELLRLLDDWIAATSQRSLPQQPAASTSTPPLSRPGDAR